MTKKKPSQRAIRELIEETEQFFENRTPRFHWKFWAPLDCIGGRVWFGRYYRCTVDGKTTLQTPEQFRVKSEMGLI